MLGIVTGSHAVPILKKHVTVSADEDGAKGLIASFKCLARQFYATLQKWAFICRYRILSHTINPIFQVNPSSLSASYPTGPHFRESCAVRSEEHTSELQSRF